VTDARPRARLAQRRRAGPSPLLTALAALALAGCATARGYLDPEGPVYEWDVAGEPGPEPTAFRIVTFNIAHGRKLEPAIAGLGTHPELRGADVLVLQEMTAEGVEAIASALSMNAVYFPASRLHERDSGNAVLSRWPVLDRWKVVLPHKTRIVGNVRVAVAARLKVAGSTLVVYSVHLGSPIGLSPGRRRDQAEAVLADTRRVTDPVVVAGDFNSGSVGEVFVEGGFAWPTRGVGHTVKIFSFDHIFTRGLLPRIGAGVARELDDASDHRPVWAAVPLHEP